MRIFAFFSTFIAIVMAGCAIKDRTDHIPAVTNFNLQRYMGTWYEIARYPHAFEKGMSHVSATYSLLSNGKIQVLNKGILPDGSVKLIKGHAIAGTPKNSGNLKVSFFRPFYGKYRIIYLSPDYDLAIVTASTKDYLWLLSRTREITPEQKELFLKKITDFGFSPEKLLFVDQKEP